MSEGGRAKDLKHPDCRYCAESLRVNVGLMEENRQLKRKLSESRLGKLAETLGAVSELFEAARTADGAEAALSHVDAAEKLLLPYRGQSEEGTG